jgi:hypothetical protein
MSNSPCWNPVAVLTGATLGAIADRAEIVAIVKPMISRSRRQRTRRRPTTADGEMHRHHAGGT